MLGYNFLFPYKAKNSPKQSPDLCIADRPRLRILRFLKMIYEMIKEGHLLSLLFGTVDECLLICQ